MSIADYFDARYMLLIHLAQLGLTVLIIVLAVARLAIPDAILSRAHIMAISMGIKSLVILLYQLLASHTRRFEKWASLKAYAILNSIEVLFWATVMGLLFQANGTPQICVPGTSACGVSWAMAVFSLFLFLLYIWASIASIIEFRRVKKSNASYGSSTPMSYGGK